MNWHQFTSTPKTSDTEKNYPNIDRELLGVVHAVEKFSNFTTGFKSIIHTDHKPLLALFQKNIVKAPPRFARLLLRVSHYDLELVYKKGKEMYISDSLSHMPNHNVDIGKMIPGLMCPSMMYTIVLILVRTTCL